MTQKGRGRTTERKQESKSLRMFMLKEGNLALEISAKRKKRKYNSPEVSKISPFKKSTGAPAQRMPPHYHILFLLRSWVDCPGTAVQSLVHLPSSLRVSVSFRFERKHLNFCPYVDYWVSLTSCSGQNREKCQNGIISSFSFLFFIFIF